jgi:hypothetical protein
LLEVIVVAASARNVGERLPKPLAFGVNAVAKHFSNTTYMRTPHLDDENK